MNDIATELIRVSGKEGENHLRISLFAKTTLGRILDPKWKAGYFIPKIGSFGSAICFANWVATDGNDDARWDVRIRSKKRIERFNDLVVYGKYHQICRLKKMVEEEIRKIPSSGIPWFFYNIHKSGVIEIDKWREYPSTVKKIVDHIVDPERGPKSPYPWETEFPGLLNYIEEKIKNITHLG